MDRLRKKYEQIAQSLTTFDKAIILFEKKAREKEQAELAMREHDSDANEILLGLRDSIVQRFEYTIDGLWKYLKEYLEIVAGVVPQLNTPKHIVRTCATARLVSEEQSATIIEMIDYRNNTSHRYQEDLAEIIKNGARRYCDLLKEVLERTQPPR